MSQSENQMQNLGLIRALALASTVPMHQINEEADGYRCACGYGLGDTSGDFFARYGAHLVLAT